MRTLQQMLEHLLNGASLSEADAGRLLEQLTAADLAPALAGALLAALRAKGVAAAELRGFAGAMRSLARKPELPPDLDAILRDAVASFLDGARTTALLVGNLAARAAAVPGTVIAEQPETEFPHRQLGIRPEQPS